MARFGCVLELRSISDVTLSIGFEWTFFLCLWPPPIGYAVCSRGGIFLPSLVTKSCRPPIYWPKSASHMSYSWATTFEGSPCLIKAFNGTLHVPKCIKDSAFHISRVRTLSFKYLARYKCSSVELSSWSSLLTILSDGSMSKILVRPLYGVMSMRLSEPDFWSMYYVPILIWLVSCCDSPRFFSKHVSLCTEAKL